MEIIQFLPDIFSSVQEQRNAATAVILPTSSGKSIGIPAFFSQAGEGTRIFCSLPTINAVVSLAEYQRHFSKDLPITPTIGTGAEGEVKYDKDTLIVYATSGHLRRKLLQFFKNGKASTMDFTDVLLVDEVHSGTVDNFMIVSLWKEAFNQKKAMPPLILASATYSVETSGSEKRDSTINTLLKSEPRALTPKVIQPVINTGYKISVFYNNLDPHMDSNEMFEGTAQVAFNYIKENFKDTAGKIGDMLIFASGKKAVNEITFRLKNFLSTSPLKGKVSIVQAYSALSSEDLNKIYEPAPEGTMKVIIATNIAESAITLDNLKYVIDTLTEKRPESSPNGSLRLVLHHISKDSSQQRAGRTGRVRDGIVYRMLTEASYDKLEQSRPEEIYRVPLHSYLMEVINTGLDVSKFFSVPIKESRAFELKIKENMKTLEQYNFIEKKEEGTFSITESGRFVTLLPLNIKNSAILWRWITTLDVPIFPCICLCVLLDSFGPPYFYLSKDAADISIYKSEKFSRFMENASTDFEVYINMFLGILTDINGIFQFIRSKGKSQEFVNNLKSWCGKYSCNNKKISELFKIIKLVYNGINYAIDHESYFNLKQETMKDRMILGSFTKDGVLKYFRPLMRNAYNSFVLNYNAATKLYEDAEKNTYKFDFRALFIEPSKSPNLSLVALNVTESKKEGADIQRFINLYDMVEMSEESKEQAGKSKQVALSLLSKLKARREEEEKKKKEKREVEAPSLLSIKTPLSPKTLRKEKEEAPGTPLSPRKRKEEMKEKEIVLPPETPLSPKTRKERNYCT